ncbi:nuclear protein MDM1 isoform X2 [Hoplias malabaricus]|uniref:nuclear protein MDM1 isoform X2 n=1 Tax=Hoplias malabaricus TaxID=27720 RepID=UPI003463719B
MTVRFKGISEYQSKYKTGPKRVKNTSLQHRMKLAGLRSDQQGISKEPQFQSKRRVPFYPTQVSSSLQWGDSGIPRRQKNKAKPVSPPCMVHVAQTSNGEKLETPLAPRVSKPQQALTTQGPSLQIARPFADQKKQEKPSNGVKHVLRKKAGLRSERKRNGRHSSEYQRQFLWKSPAAESPLLSAQQMLYTSNRSIPPFKSEPAGMETEYKRSFKGSSPPRPPRLRRDLDLNEVPLFQRENVSVEKSTRKKKRDQQLNKKLRPKEENPPESQQQEMRAPCEHKDASPKVMRRVKTEYTSNFRSPLQYYYRDGAWVRSRASGEEVRELREKAEVYRRRAWGTHFSRQHLSQILSEQNCLWEVSSTSSSSTLTEPDSHSPNSPIIEALDLARVDCVKGSSSPVASVSLSTSRKSSFEGVGLSNGPTIPLERRLAWGEEEAGPCKEGVAEIKQLREMSPVQQPKKSHEEEDLMSEHSVNKNEKVKVPKRQPSSPTTASQISVEEGRLPTPKMKNMLAAQRTHYDRTTPVTGGAMLVSPPKNSSKTSRRGEAPLGKTHSPYRYLSHSSPPRVHSKAENGSLLRSPSAAGLATVDPLPLREEIWTGDSPGPSPTQKIIRTPLKQSSSDRLIASNSPHANRIQGTLRNPEFQHNGDLGLHRPELFVFPSSDSENDDRMSEISSRSAASCSMASQVLDRAQRRKEEFWGNC